MASAPSTFSQDYDATQPMPFADEPIADENESDTDENISTSPWGRLISGGVERDLSPKLEQFPHGDRDVYTIGRNRHADFQVVDGRVSGFHCRLLRNEVEGALLCFLEDTSSNGTYINKMKMGKQEKRRLSSGDEIALLSPKLLKDDSKNCTYTFIDLLEKSRSIRGSNGGSRSGGLARSLTAAATADRQLKENNKDAEAARADLAREDKKRMITRARRADKAVSAALGAKMAARRYHAECLNHIDNIERCAYDLRGSGWWHQLVMNRQAGRVENQRGRQGPGAQPSSSTPPSSPLRPQRTPSSRETKPKRQAVRRATPPRLGGLFGASDESSMEQDD